MFLILANNFLHVTAALDGSTSRGQGTTGHWYKMNPLPHMSTISVSLQTQSDKALGFRIQSWDFVEKNNTDCTKETQFFEDIYIYILTQTKIK